VSLIVLWQHEAEMVPLSGGHVVLSIVGDAANRCGLRIYNQACSPGCENIFLHANLLLSPDDVERLEFVSRDSNDIYLKCREWPDEKELLIDIFLDLGIVVGYFSKQKNLARRVIDLEAEAYSQLMHLLAHYTEHAEAPVKKILSRLKWRWSNRHWRSEVRLLGSRIWLCISGIELIKRNWMEQNKAFLSSVEEAKLAEIFRIDYSGDVAAVDSMDLSRLESICAQVESRLDNRALSWATAGGAVAGAVAGALVTFMH
jgi:hypothetical protein